MKQWRKRKAEERAKPKQRYDEAEADRKPCELCQEKHAELEQEIAKLQNRADRHREELEDLSRLLMQAVGMIKETKQALGARHHPV
jgi:uncharacterized protein YlxW (UPF0749 family)